jgi:membrane-bound lytic murein transglycosylase MltF
VGYVIIHASAMDPRLPSLILVLLLAAPAAPAADKSNEVRALPIVTRPWKGDFDGMLERRTIRVLVPYSRTLYFNDKGRERGVTADQVREFERFVNRRYAKVLGQRPLTVYMIPATRDELLKDVSLGMGDIAAGNLTVTEARRKVVDFVSQPGQKDMSELVITGPHSAPLAHADDLSGRSVHVRRASSYYDSLVTLNQRLEKSGRRPANLVIVPDALEDEDMLEMLHAGLFDAIVVDDWKARMWAQALPKIKVNDAAVRTGGHIGWAIRKHSPRLQQVIQEFHAATAKQYGGQQARMKEYAGRIGQLRDPTGSSEWKRFEATLDLFRKYGDRYGFDPLMLAAQGYQESKLDQNARSPGGAVGVMQLMPATGRSLKVGDIHRLEPNIHGGAKYLDQLMAQSFPGARFDAANRSLFAFAAYNAGPGRISQMRDEARRRGLDPDKWFNNVEIVTAEKVGIETPTYVRNIYKYYTAYTLMLEVEEVRSRARQQVSPKK